MENFSWPVRVYYEDTDSGGVVYYANYLRFMERARTEWLRRLGVEQDRVRDEYGVIFAVRHIAVDYLKPARFNDALQVTVELRDLGRASITFGQRVLKQAEGNAIELCRGEVKIACIDADMLRPKPIPESIKTEIMRDH
ncbi:MAG: tol-pal system-associated acyl-CoA thioesterase [Gammaproteobacteria bacterium]|nr:tol-pal system-associated acyl-CoA thioesterase [Gammaproteobacteria bacterium]